MKRKAVFLDRDGVLITERGEYNYLPEHLDIVVGSVEALKRLYDASYLLIVITNQGGIAKGLYTHKQTQEIHKQLSEFYRSYGIKISEFYYCPHYPVDSACVCRKPDSQLLEKAISRFDINCSLSWMIGDNPRDIEAAEAAGVRGILIPPNDDLRNYIDCIE